MIYINSKAKQLFISKQSSPRNGSDAVCFSFRSDLQIRWISEVCTLSDGGDKDIGGFNSGKGGFSSCKWIM
jgi:hypothetical protein